MTTTVPRCGRRPAAAQQPATPQTQASQSASGSTTSSSTPAMMAATMPPLSAAIAAELEQLPYVKYVNQPLGAETDKSAQPAAELLTEEAGASHSQLGVAAQLVQEE